MVLLCTPCVTNRNLPEKVFTGSRYIRQELSGMSVDYSPTPNAPQYTVPSVHVLELPVVLWRSLIYMST
jgi:hypothetical protein